MTTSSLAEVATVGAITAIETEELCVTTATVAEVTVLMARDRAAGTVMRAGNSCNTERRVPGALGLTRAAAAAAGGIEEALSPAAAEQTAVGAEAAAAATPLVEDSS